MILGLIFQFVYQTWLQPWESLVIHREETSLTVQTYRQAGEKEEGKEKGSEIKLEELSRQIVQGTP